jgi:proline iminopeptidase
MITSGFLQVSSLHSIYYEIHGTVTGRPAVILHGGPGGGIQPNMHKIYDLKKWCVVLFDQRGCGKSTPYGSTYQNTTWDLIHDIEFLRIMCGFDKWFVSGGSWGTTLALAYAQTYPTRVTGMLLRGLCLSDSESFKWLYEKGGASQVYPDAWRIFTDVMPDGLCDKGWREIMRFYHKKLNDPSNAVVKRYADAWWGWESAISRLYPKEDAMTQKETIAIARLENHYFVHNAWLKERELLQGLKKLRGIPITIVHGRYDMVCPIVQAFMVKAVLPGVKLVVVPDTGHAGMDPGNWDAQRAALRKML